MGGQSHQCDKCGKWFLSPGALADHKKAAHPRDLTQMTQADFSAAEMRIMAAMLKHAEEGGPVPALRLGERTDVHDERAKREGITRKQAKALNYGEWYGVNNGVFK